MFVITVPFTVIMELCLFFEMRPLFLGEYFGYVTLRPDLDYESDLMPRKGL
jgi:hypothetical protein